jgi:hypothetical protein
MVNISLQNPQSVLSLKNKWIDGFTLATQVKASSTVPFCVFDPEQLTLKATLRRNGQEIEMFNHTLKNLVILSHLRTTTYRSLNPNFFIALDVMNTIGLNTLRFDFGGPLNLIGDDELLLEWSLNSTYFQSGIDSANSFISLDETECTDVEYFVPITRSKVIEGSQDNPSYSLGDNVMSIVIANYDKASIYTADSVIKTLRLKTEKFAKNDTFNELLAKGVSYYSDINEFFARYQTFQVYSGADELDGVELNLSLNSANVTSSKNYVLWRTFYTDNWLVTRATTISEQMNQKADKKGTFNSALLSHTM